MADLRYPIGRFRMQPRLPEAERASGIGRLESLPARLRALVEGLGEEELDTPYRPDGWTVRQVLHHLPDSHLNGFLRVKLGLTEDSPVIAVYDQDRFAGLADVDAAPIGASLAILDGLHVRWAALFRSLGDAEWARTVQHPESGPVRIDQLLDLYAWHGDHHLAQIERLAEREGW